MSMTPTELLRAKYDAAVEMTLTVKAWHSEETDVPVQRELFVIARGLDRVCARFLYASIETEKTGGATAPLPGRSPSRDDLLASITRLGDEDVVATVEGRGQVQPRSDTQEA